MQTTKNQEHGSSSFRYAMVNRPAGIGSIPRGLQYGVDARPAKGEPHHDMARHGILVTERALTVEELRAFELAPLVDPAMLGQMAERICADGMSDYAAEYIETQRDEPESFCRNVADRARHLDGGVRYSICSEVELGSLVLEALHRVVESSATSTDPS